MIDTAGVVLSGLILGGVGSGHCAAMCGPLVMLTSQRAPAVSARARAVHTVLYNGGRLAMYTALGALIGVSGSALASVGLGRVLALAAAAAVLLQAFAAWHSTRRGFEHRMGAVVTRALGRTGAWMRHHRVGGPMVFGALTGLLPCGLVYAALTAAAGFGSGTTSSLFMLAFGCGTVPMLATVGLSASRLSGMIPPRLKRAAPFALAAVALLLIFRATTGPISHGMHAAPVAVSLHHHGS